ncbi:Sodium/hydrogen exchanger 2 [Capsicum annuum]|nr:Sodium/hydrogen exchanger 2 [Capsicum annuum]
MAYGLASLLPKLGSLGTSDHTSVVSINLFVALLCACIVIGHLLEENRWINESITALIIGLVVGVVILLRGPPSENYSATWVPCQQITTEGAFHTFKKLGIGFLDIGDYLAIGAIFAATDSVCTLQVLHQDETPLLYSLVFGEGVVNDATSVVLFNAIQNFDLSSVNPSIALSFLGNFLYLFLASTFLGAATGLLSAYVIKKLYFGRHSTDREVALMMLMAYLSYMLAELFYLSGILTVFFCGIVMSHYTWHNVTESSRVTTRHAFATLSFLAETFLFLYVGMDALDIEKWKFVSDSPGLSVAVSSILMGLILLSRALFILPLSLLSNVIIWWAGLMRGAVSMALAYNKVFGLLTKPLISLLLPPHRQSSTVSSDANTPKAPLLGSREDSEVDLNGQDLPHPPSLRMLLTAPSHKVHRYWRKFDDSFMRPMFGGRGFAPPAPSSPTDEGA